MALVTGSEGTLYPLRHISVPDFRVVARIASLVDGFMHLSARHEAAQEYWQLVPSGTGGGTWRSHYLGVFRVRVRLSAIELKETQETVR